MPKELYDPHMFNYMWESLDQDRILRAFLVARHVVLRHLHFAEQVTNLSVARILAIRYDVYALHAPTHHACTNRCGGDTCGKAYDVKQS